MKKWVAVYFTLGILVGTLIAPSAVAIAQRAEPHPQINRAVAALEVAKGHLKRAAHDFGGHRVEAIAAIDRALEQLRLALQYDRN